MYHRKSNRKFGRETKQRAALLCSLANALIAHGKITTTETKAKSLKVFVEKLITKSRVGNITSSRLLVSVLGVKAAQKLAKEIAPKYSGMPGGYTRIIKLPQRISDGARMAAIEFIK